MFDLIDSFIRELRRERIYVDPGPGFSKDLLVDMNIDMDTRPASPRCTGRSSR